MLLLRTYQSTPQLQKNASDVAAGLAGISSILGKLTDYFSSAIIPLSTLPGPGVEKVSNQPLALTPIYFIGIPQPIHYLSVTLFFFFFEKRLRREKGS